MKNIHILPTDKPSNLLLCIKDYIEHKNTPAENSDTKGNFKLGLGIYANTKFYQPQNIYVTNDEKIGTDEYYFHLKNNEFYNSGRIDETDKDMKFWRKIILTTNQDLIKDDVQAIDDEFLEWFVKNQSCEKVEVKSYKLHFGSTLYKIIIPKEEPKQELERYITINNAGKTKQETPEEETLTKIKFVLSCGNNDQAIRILEQYREFIQERSYSEEEVREIIKLSCEEGMFIQRTMNDKVKIPYTRIKEFTIKIFEQFKKK